MGARIFLLWIILASPIVLAGEWHTDKLEQKPVTVLCASNSPQFKRWELKAIEYKEFEKSHLDGLLKGGWSLLRSTASTPLQLRGELVISVIYEDWRPWPTKTGKKNVEIRGNQILLVYERQRYQYGENEKRPKVWVHQVVVAEDFTVANLKPGEYAVFLNKALVGKLTLTSL